MEAEDEEEDDDGAAEGTHTEEVMTPTLTYDPTYMVHEPSTKRGSYAAEKYRRKFEFADMFVDLLKPFAAQPHIQQPYLRSVASEK
eukprot:51459-Amphidinium_carterae.2